MSKCSRSLCVFFRRSSKQRLHSVIIAIDRKELGDDFTVELRESELVGADYLITCERPTGCRMLGHPDSGCVAAGKERGKPTHFSCLRGGGAHEFEVVLQPLPHVIPRCHGFDCTPSYLIIGGLVFCPLTWCAAAPPPPPPAHQAPARNCRI